MAAMVDSATGSGDTAILARENNEWIRQMCDIFLPGEVRSSYVCECGDPLCQKTIALTPAEYERIRSVGTRFVISTNHEDPEVDMVTEEHPSWAVLEKLPGPSAREAERSDPRRTSKGAR